ncbi:MAG: phage major tail protein, TP901-1 family [Pseudomonadota bacterium]
MTAQAGKDLLLKLDHSGAGAFETVAGLRATRISFNAAAVDVTSLESTDRWRELLAGAGVRSATISGSGVFKDSSTDASIRSAFFNGAIMNWRILVPDFGAIEGPFHIGSLDYSGDHDGEAAFELSLASAGPLSFTAL